MTLGNPFSTSAAFRRMAVVMLAMASTVILGVGSVSAGPRLLVCGTC